MAIFELLLPFKTDDVILPKNRQMALKRFTGLKRKLEKR